MNGCLTVFSLQLLVPGCISCSLCLFLLLFVEIYVHSCFYVSPFSYCFSLSVYLFWCHLISLILSGLSLVSHSLLSRSLCLHLIFNSQINYLFLNYCLYFLSAFWFLKITPPRLHVSGCINSTVCMNDLKPWPIVPVEIYNLISTEPSLLQLY